MTTTHPIHQPPADPSTSRRLRHAAVIAAVLLAVLALAGCNVGADHHKGMGDAGVQQSRVATIAPNQGSVGQQNDPANVINFSDKYPDVEFKCNGLDGIYTDTRSSGFFVVVPSDPQCHRGGGGS